MVNPDNKAGRVTLITRMSSAHLEEHLPKLILAVQKAGLNVSTHAVVFSCCTVVPLLRIEFVETTVPHPLLPKCILLEFSWTCLLSYFYDRP